MEAARTRGGRRSPRPIRQERSLEIIMKMADIVSLTMHPDARREVVLVLGEIVAGDIDPAETVIEEHKPGTCIALRRGRSDTR
jgi:hypothetical protein